MSEIENKQNLQYESVLFVFYSFKNDKYSSWCYDDLPEGWIWTGTGSTCPFDEKGREQFIKKHPRAEYFSREEQFNGPLETQKITKEYLEAFFNKLKFDNIIKIFKIRDSFIPGIDI